MVMSICRAVARASWFAGEILFAAWRSRTVPGAFNAGDHPSPALSDASHRQRAARWLYGTCVRLLRIFALDLKVSGAIPTRGLLVSNHLSYLDIIVLGALTPCVFVAKSEVARWPVFGWFARRMGTIFVNRRSRRDTIRANEEIRAALAAESLVVLFPEGTSSDGSTVLPFKSSLLAAAAGETPGETRRADSNLRQAVPITVAVLHYDLADGNAGTEVCYWGNHTLVPHLLKLLSKRSVRAQVAFIETPNTSTDRKSVAFRLHAEASALHSILRANSDSTLAVKSALPIRDAGGVQSGLHACGTTQPAPL